MSEKQAIQNLTDIGYIEKEARELFDFYLSADCPNGIENFILMKKIAMGI